MLLFDDRDFAILLINMLRVEPHLDRPPLSGSDLATCFRSIEGDLLGRRALASGLPLPIHELLVQLLRRIWKVSINGPPFLLECTDRLPIGAYGVQDLLRLLIVFRQGPI